MLGDSPTKQIESLNRVSHQWYSFSIFSSDHRRKGGPLDHQKHRSCVPKHGTATWSDWLQPASLARWASTHWLWHHAAMQDHACRESVRWSQLVWLVSPSWSPSMHASHQHLSKQLQPTNARPPAPHSTGLQGSRSIWIQCFRWYCWIHKVQETE